MRFLENKKIYNNQEACYLLSLGKKMRKTTWSEIDYIMFGQDGELIDEDGMKEDYDLSQGDKWVEYKDR